MNIFIAQIINGISLGSIYALVVLGMNLLILVRRVVHFAYAHIVVMAMCAAWLVLKQTHNNIGLAILAAMLTGILLTVITEPIFRPLALRRAFLETQIASLGIAIILTEIMSHYINSGQAVSFPSVLTGGGAMVKLGLITFSLANIYTLAGGIIASVVLLRFLYQHKQGRAFRAIAQDLDVARLLGIPFNKTGVYGFAIAGVLAGIIAILLAMTLGSASPGLGDNLAVVAMVLILFAGMGNLKGGVICALLMGLARTMVLAYLPGRWTEAIVFGSMMIVILWKPQGLFGTRV